MHAAEQTSIVSPVLDEWIALATCDEMVCHGLPAHPRHRHLEQTRRVLKLLPTYAVQMPEQNYPDVHVNATVQVQAGSAQEVCRVWANVLSRHGAFHERLGRHKFQSTVGAARYTVEDLHSPAVGTAETGGSEVDPGTL